MKRPMSLPTAAREATALTGIGALIKRRLMILMMFGVSFGFTPFGVQSVSAAVEPGAD